MVVVLLLALSIALLNGVVVRVGMDYLNKTFAAVNDETDPEFPAPDSKLRSGGPESLASWESLGHQGRVFVSAGPTVDELSKFNGKPAIEPIRAYAGLHSADGIKATAALAAEELLRTGGLNRDVVAVATTTGTGWINEAEASALEYMYNGNTAIVSMQYSFLPSWLSFLVDKENARQAGQALFEAVDALIREMPEAQRPKLVVFGESLGSFGGEAPFLSLNNLIARTDGALFSGPTFNNTIWTDLTHNRDAGSPEWLPIFDKGENVRFVARPDNLGPPDDPWGKPRVVYLQHASDPIAWWNPDLLFARTGLAARAPRLRRVAGACSGSRSSRSCRCPRTWRSRSTFPTGTATSTSRTSPTRGRQILQPPGWTPEKTERLRPLLSQRRERLNENAFGRQRVVAADDVGGPVQPEVDAATPRPGWRCSPPSTAPPIRRRRRRPAEACASLVGSQRHSSTLRSMTSAAATSPSRSRCACGRMSTSTAPRSSAPGTSLAGNRCNLARAASSTLSMRLAIRSLSLRAFGQFGAVATQGVPRGHLVVRHRRQRRRIGVHAQSGRGDGEAVRRRPHDVVHPAERKRRLVARVEPTTA